VEERLTSSLLVFVRGVDKLKVPSTHVYPTRHATRGLFTVPKSRTDYRRRAMTTWNFIPHQVADASNRIRFKKQVKIHLMEQRGQRDRRLGDAERDKRLGDAERDRRLGDAERERRLGDARDRGEGERDRGEDDAEQKPLGQGSRLHY
jgi:hypothetical protein